MNLAINQNLIFQQQYVAIYVATVGFLNNRHFGPTNVGLNFTVIQRLSSLRNKLLS